jgi:hypothetical protein
VLFYKYLFLLYYFCLRSGLRKCPPPLHRALQRVGAVAVVLALGGCAAFYTPARHIDAQARAGDLQPVAAFAGTPVRGWLRQPPDGATSADGTLTLYIEGDGAEWRSKFEPPIDPTPENPLALRLALRDPSMHVAYLGRPCQYLGYFALSRCPSILWIQGRYGDEAVTIMSAAVDLMLLSANLQRVRLVGYSGGGTIATLIAARRKDVVCIVTVAAPLDTETWTAAIDISPLRYSLNPLTYAAQLAAVPQVHLAAADDALVPHHTLQRVRDALPQVRVEVIEGFDHDCCWVLAG